MRTNPFNCLDCEQNTATAESGYTVATVKFCTVHKAEQRADLFAARAANPEVDAVHRMIERARG